MLKKQPITSYIILVSKQEFSKTSYYNKVLILIIIEELKRTEQNDFWMIMRQYYFYVHLASLTSGSSVGMIVSIYALP